MESRWSSRYTEVSVNDANKCWATTRKNKHLGEMDTIPLAVPDRVRVKWKQEPNGGYNKNAERNHFQRSA